MTINLFGEDVEEKKPRARRAVAVKDESPLLTVADDSDATLVAIYADESCLGNGREGSNHGGAGGVLEMIDAGSGELTRWDYWISEPSTTNNRMAFRSVIEAFAELDEMKR